MKKLIILINKRKNLSRNEIVFVQLQIFIRIGLSNESI